MGLPHDLFSEERTTLSNQIARAIDAAYLANTTRKQPYQDQRSVRCPFASN